MDDGLFNFGDAIAHCQPSKYCFTCLKYTCGKQHKLFLNGKWESISVNCFRFRISPTLTIFVLYWCFKISSIWCQQFQLSRHIAISWPPYHRCLERYIRQAACPLRLPLLLSCNSIECLIYQMLWYLSGVVLLDNRLRLKTCFTGELKHFLNCFSC